MRTEMLNFTFWRTVWRRFSADRCFTEAQALTYTTLFSLVPLLALAFAIARLFIQAEDIVAVSEQFLTRFLNPAAIETVQETLLRLLAKAQQAPLGRASMLIFFVMILGLLMETEGVLNRIFRVKKGRSFPQKIAAYWMILTLGPIFLLLPPAGAFYLSHFAKKFVATLLLKVLYVLTVVLFFTGLYLYLPNRRIPLRAALFGGGVAGLMWLLTAYLYTFYTSKAVAYSKLYGSLSALPFFLLWLFLSWAVTLFGAEAAGVYEEKDWLGNGYRLPPAMLSVAVMLELVEAYTRGETPLSLVTLSQTLRVPPGEVERVIEEFEVRGLVLVTEEGVIPTRSPSAISLRELVVPFEGDLPETPPEPPNLKRAYFLFKHREAPLEITLEALRNGQVSFVPK
ncbi:YihY/virulence factor BrkB family protein [Thermosulfurimonas sp. F29]|uniref:YihY/virulence factor BrkB family protein n=1 Tax=Thermosulfurimonas sp. F29 TaxID=2867247 RepID=UPI001C82ED92|nr:YihY/virulence factor BrkB family protein [Thermosulfurimonas sp. F29]MBX6422685.1 YihY/virulence factor BrkB family protein [Thermosulfurimonas sp. F29]